jgi:hypothetical protein
MSTNLGHTSQGPVVLDVLIGGGAKLVDLLLSKPMRPALRVVLEVLGLPDSGTGDLLGKLLIGTDQFVQRIVLARSLEPIGEEGQKVLLDIRGCILRGSLGNAWSHGGVKSIADQVF